MRFHPALEVNRAPRRIVMALAGFAVALTMVRLSAARFEQANRAAN